jgi:hypothetical protein
MSQHFMKVYIYFFLRFSDPLIKIVSICACEPDSEDEFDVSEVLRNEMLY